MTTAWGLKAFTGALVIAIFATTTTAAVVKVSASSPNVSPKQETAVALSLGGAQNVSAIELDLVYDPALCTATKVEKGALASNTMMESSVSRPGRVRIALISQSGMSGDGELASVQFAAGDSAGTSAMTVENVRAWSLPKGHETTAGPKHLIDAEISAISGVLTIASSQRMLLWGGVAAAAVLILLLVIAKSRRKRAV